MVTDSIAALIALQDAARAVARLLSPGLEAVSVTVRVAHEIDLITIAVLPGDEAEEVLVPEPPALPPPRGWAFGENSARFDGKPVAIHGRQLDLLRVLAAAVDPVKLDGLRAAWGTYPAEETTVRWTIGKLRESLALAFPGFEDPVTNGPGGYSLAIR